MKAKINKSEVMKEAWHLYRLFNRWNRITKKFYNNKIIRSFSHCLKRAWENVKREMERPVVESVSIELLAGAADYYRGNRRYYGD